MAFRSCASLLLLLSVCFHFIAENRTAVSNSRDQCQCITEKGTVPWKKITNFTITDKYALCNKVEIILELANKQICLSPNSKQGKQLQRCWKSINFNTQKKKTCLAVRRKNKPQKPKNP